MANISSYNQLSSWNEDDDLLFVQQPDAPKKAHPSQMKEYILEGLDVASVGGTGKYISAISEADGKISATAETMDEVPTQDSNKPVKSGGVFNAIDDSVSLKTATGNPITLTDAANANAEELSMTIEPIQSGSGDPSPENVRPISGLTEGKVTRTRKNLLPLTVGGIKSANTSGTWDGNVYTVNGVSFTVNTDSDGNVISIVVSGTSNNSIDFYFYKGQIVISNNSTLSTEVTRTAGFDEYIGTIAISTGYDSVDVPSGTYTNCALYISSNIAMNNLTFKPMIRFATETDPTFEPYTAANATITLGQTVYGGSVNFKTGEVTVTHGMVDLGSLTWIYESASTRFAATLSDMAYAESTTALPDFKCSQYAPVSIVDFNNGADKAIRGNDAGARDIRIRDTAYTDAAAFKTAMSGVQLCYELATPTTLTLTPAELELLKGNNTITANGAEISIEYYPDNAIGALAERVDDVQEQITGLNTNIKDFKNLFVSQPESTTETYTFSIPTNAIAELTAVLGTNLAQYYIIAAGTTLRIIKHTDDVTGLNVTLDSIRRGVYNYTVTVPAYALSVAYRIS